MPLQPSLLVVDDDEIHRAVSAYVLQDAGYRIRVAGNGREALAAARGCAPDLILLDLDMPELNGWETIRHLRRSEEHTDTPVIALTSHTIEDEDLREAGFSGYARKTAPMKQLIGLVEQCLRDRFAAASRTFASPA